MDRFRLLEMKPVHNDLNKRKTYDDELLKITHFYIIL